MKNSFLAILVFLGSFSSCIQHPEQPLEGNQDATNTNRIQSTIEFAEGFDLYYKENGTKIVTHSFGENTPFKDSFWVSLRHSNEPTEEEKAQVIQMACQSSTHLSFIETLGGLNQVCGLCGMQYVNDTVIRQTLEQNQVKEICLGDGVITEVLLAAEPDLFLTYPFQSTATSNYEAIGLNDLYIAEYLEKSPLARLEWIKVFGVLLAQEVTAEAFFNEKKETYQKAQKNAQPLDQTFIMNLPFEDNWFMPASESLIVSLMKDAGLDYFYAEEKGTENILHPKEKVWSDGGIADYWVIIAARPKGYDLTDLVLEDPVYQTFRSVQKNQVIFCNSAEVPYFTKGVLEPDVMLKDLLFATGQITNHSPVYFHLLN
jgi:iron complex transport system substrate-binding protein